MNKKSHIYRFLKQVIKVVETLTDLPNRDVNFELPCEVDPGLYREQSRVEHEMPSAGSFHFEEVFVVFLVELESAFYVIE